MTELVSDKVLAEWLDVVPRTIRDLASRGLVTRAARGRYALRDSIRQYIGNLRATAAGRATTGDIDLFTERALLARQQRVGVEMKNAATRGELVSASEVGEAWLSIVGVMRERIIAIPARLQQGGLSRQQAELVRAEIWAALEELAETEVVARDGAND